MSAGYEFYSSAINLGANVANTTVQYNYLISGINGQALSAYNTQLGNQVRNNVLKGNNSPYVAHVDKVDILSNTFIGTVQANPNPDIGNVLDAAGTSLVQYNAFNTTGPASSLIAFNNS